VEFKEQYLEPFVKIYSFADALKWVCMDVLGLSYRQCHGTDEDKNSSTHLKWENMPGVYTNKKMFDLTVEANPDLDNNILLYHPEGPMTAREVLQFVGTGIFRKMYARVWIDCTLRNIKRDNPALAIVSDVRFPDEVLGIKETGGKAIRLTRKVGEDLHESETALDNFMEFDAVLDNSNSPIEEQNQMIEKYLKGINWLISPISEFENSI
jgi:hypothetical protein